MVPSEEKDDSGALDPADEAFRCTCGRPECVMARARPFREHIAELYRTIESCQYEGALTPEWDSILYPLQMAASIEDVHADTSYVDNSMASMFCGGAARYERAHSVVASRYVAALSIFTFVWTAYEAAVKASEPHSFRKEAAQDENGKRGRLITEKYSHLLSEFQGIQNFAMGADLYCNRGGLFDERLERVRARYPAKDLAFAAELVREFRNHLFHGEDCPPMPEESSGVPTEGRCRIYRFYGVARLALILIQLMARIAVEHGPKIVLRNPETQRFASPGLVLAGLHLSRSRARSNAG